MSAEVITGQRADALRIANEVRSYNHCRKREIAALPSWEGRLAVARIVASPQGAVGAMTIGQLLESIDRVGPERAEKLMIRAGVYRGSRRVRDLTPRQRTAVARTLREEA